MSAVTLAQFTGENGSLWDFPPTSKPAVCRSSFPHPQTVTGWAVCVVDHDELGIDVHGGDVNGRWFQWTNKMAAAAWLAVDTCAYVYCPEIVPAGTAYCSAWCARQDKGTADNGPESEAA